MPTVMLDHGAIIRLKTNILLPGSPGLVRALLDYAVLQPDMLEQHQPAFLALFCERALASKDPLQQVRSPVFGSGLTRVRCLHVRHPCKANDGCYERIWALLP